MPPIAALRDVTVEGRSADRRRAVIGAAILVLGVAASSVGLFGDFDDSSTSVAIGALLVFVGVFMLGPVFAAPRRYARSAGRSRGCAA